MPGAKSSPRWDKKDQRFRFIVSFVASSASSSFFPSLLPLIHYSIFFRYHPVFLFLHFLLIFSHSLPTNSSNFFPSFPLFIFSFFSSFLLFYFLVSFSFYWFYSSSSYILPAFSTFSSIFLSFLPFSYPSFSSFSLSFIFSSLLLTDPTQLCVRGLNQFPLPAKTMELRCSCPS